MNTFRFICSCALWNAVMVAMVGIAPIGKHASFFSVLFLLGHVLMIFMVRWFPKDFNPRTAVAVIFILGVIGRFLFIPYPVGDDISRYVWEGYIQTQGYNPYGHAPDSLLLADVARGALAPIWSQINHPELSAAYPPFSLLLFRIMACIAPHPFFFKTVMTGFDIGVMVVLTLIIYSRGISPLGCDSGLFPQPGAIFGHLQKMGRYGIYDAGVGDRNQIFCFGGVAFFNQCRKSPKKFSGINTIGFISAFHGRRGRDH